MDREIASGDPEVYRILGSFTPLGCTMSYSPTVTPTFSTGVKREQILP